MEECEDWIMTEFPLSFTGNIYNMTGVFFLAVV